MAIFRTAKSRSYKTKRLPKTDSLAQKTKETVSGVDKAPQNFLSVDQCNQTNPYREVFVGLISNMIKRIFNKKYPVKFRSEFG